MGSQPFEWAAIKITPPARDYLCARCALCPPTGRPTDRTARWPARQQSAAGPSDGQPSSRASHGASHRTGRRQPKVRAVATSTRSTDSAALLWRWRARPIRQVDEPRTSLGRGRINFSFISIGSSLSAGHFFLLVFFEEASDEKSPQRKRVRIRAAAAQLNRRPARARSSRPWRPNDQDVG